MQAKSRSGKRHILGSTLVAAATLVVALPARAQYFPIYAGPGNGYFSPRIQPFPGSTAGTGAAVAYVMKPQGPGQLDDRAVRWDSTGAVQELGNLGTFSDGRTSVRAFAINDLGTAVGSAQKIDAGVGKGDRAVRWDASGTAATELGNLGTNSDGRTSAGAYAINSAGTIVGYAYRFKGTDWQGTSATRWDASGTAATELGNLGVDTNGITVSTAYAVNQTGTAVGSAQKFVGGEAKGTRAARWGPSDTAAIELGNLGTDSSGTSDSEAFAINDVGTSVGYARKYYMGNDLGNRAVRWDASGTVATELEGIGSDPYANLTYAYDINASGVAVGVGAVEPDQDSSNRALRWDAGGTVATVLGMLGTDSNGRTQGAARAISDTGIAVGTVAKYDLDGRSLGTRAVIWGPDAAAIDLTTLLDPNSGWVRLTTGVHISNDNWVTGTGVFDPDGAGPLAATTRLFLMQVPEPGSALTLITLLALSLAGRRITSR